MLAAAVDSSGFTIYPASVWVSDNATLNVRNASNPAVFNGAVEAGYSAMIRMNGNAEIHGVLGAYHSSVMRLDSITMDGGEIYSGDGGYIRVESSTLTPTSSLYSVYFELYRNGRARINNTTVNLNGTNIGVYGFSVLNLRGSTDLGTDGVDCGDGRNVSIQSSVTLGDVSCF